MATDSRLHEELKSIPRLRGASNFRYWRARISEIFGAAGLLSHVDGTERKPDGDMLSFVWKANNAEWRNKDDEVRRALVDSTENSIKRSIADFLTAKEILDYLDDLFEEDVGFSYGILTELQQLSFDGHDIQQFNSRYRSILTEAKDCGLQITSNFAIFTYINRLASHFPDWATATLKRVRDLQLEPAGTTTTEAIREWMNSFAFIDTLMPRVGGRTPLALTASQSVAVADPILREPGREDDLVVGVNGRTNGNGTGSNTFGHRRLDGRCDDLTKRSHEKGVVDSRVPKKPRNHKFTGKIDTTRQQATQQYILPSEEPDWDTYTVGLSEEAIACPSVASTESGPVFWTTKHPDTPSSPLLGPSISHHLRVGLNSVPPGPDHHYPACSHPVSLDSGHQFCQYCFDGLVRLLVESSSPRQPCTFMGEDARIVLRENTIFIVALLGDRSDTVEWYRATICKVFRNVGIVGLLGMEIVPGLRRSGSCLAYQLCHDHAFESPYRSKQCWLNGSREHDVTGNPRPNGKARLLCNSHSGTSSQLKHPAARAEASHVPMQIPFDETMPVSSPDF